MAALPPFAHPVTHRPLVRQADGWRCPESGEVFRLQNGAPVFVSNSLREHMHEERHGFLNALKTFLRRFPRLYIALIYTISPICFVGKSAQSFVREFPDDKVLVNVGSGIHTFAPHVLNLDVFWYKGVDVVGDAQALPFLSDSVDGIVCECLLEHVPNPQKVVDEFVRVLKPGGRAYIAVPFVYPFHASPNDFSRWSAPGLRALLREFSVEVIAPRSGPTSALVAQLTTWSATLLSFGSAAAQEILTEVLQVVFAPLKILDLVLGRLPTAVYGASSFFAIVTKRSEHS